MGWKILIKPRADSIITSMERNLGRYRHTNWETNRPKNEVTAARILLLLGAVGIAALAAWRDKPIENSYEHLVPNMSDTIVPDASAMQLPGCN